MHKHLRRLERVWPEHPIYFVTTGTHLRKPILASSQVAGILIDEWRNARGRHGWAIGRYVIMPDHVHFFCAPELNAKPLSSFVGPWKEWASKAIKRVLDLPGHLWQEQFFDQILRASESYSQKWGLCAEQSGTRRLGRGRERLALAKRDRRVAVVAGGADAGWSGAPNCNLPRAHNTSRGQRPRLQLTSTKTKSGELKMRPPAMRGAYS